MVFLSPFSDYFFFLSSYAATLRNFIKFSSFMFSSSGVFQFQAWNLTLSLRISRQRSKAEEKVKLLLLQQVFEKQCNLKEFQVEG